MEYRYANHPLLYKNGIIKGFGEVLAYLIDRYSSIEERMLETFRYVTCDTHNLDTFSYEYGSILRDAGSIFGSAMDKLARGTGATPQNRKSNQFTIVDYKEWLLTNVPDIPQMSMELNILRKNKFLIPFSALLDPDTKIGWWNAFNDLKHSDLDNFAKGNLQNAINGMASIAGLFILMYHSNPAEHVRLFHNFGYRNPMQEVEQSLFCAS
jgi:hypothetical protein